MLDQICLINLVVENHIDKARGLAFFSITPKQHWKGMQGLRDCVAEKGSIPCVGCVWLSQRSGQFWCRCSWLCNELTSLALSLSQLLDGLINPTLLAWLCVFVYPWLRVSLMFPYSLENHAQLGVGIIVERLRSMLAYAWVERCSDVAGCGTSSS